MENNAVLLLGSCAIKRREQAWASHSKAPSCKVHPQAILCEKHTCRLSVELCHARALAPPGPLPLTKKEKKSTGKRVLLERVHCMCSALIVIGNELFSTHLTNGEGLASEGPRACCSLLPAPPADSAAATGPHPGPRSLKHSQPSVTESTAS